MRTQQQVEPRRSTDCLVAIGKAESHPALGQRVHVGRLGNRIAVTAQGWLQVIDQDQQDIGALYSVTLFTGERRNQQPNGQ
jgi:hypothetical protein